MLGHFNEILVDLVFLSTSSYIYGDKIVANNIILL